MPVDEVALVLKAADADAIRDMLIAHRQQLSEQAEALSEILHRVDEYIEKGVVVSESTGARVAEINVGVADLSAARNFYQDAFEVEFGEDRHGDGPIHFHASFGTWPTDSFFLLTLWPSEERAGTANFGFVVDDLDGAYKRALNAGGSEIYPPREVDGMPRTAQLKDPSGNTVHLYQQ